MYLVMQNITMNIHNDLYYSISIFRDTYLIHIEASNKTTPIAILHMFHYYIIRAAPIFPIHCVYDGCPRL